MTASFREKTGKFLLFILGSLWGYLWVQEILSCPEWWFIGTNVLLIGAGICTAGKIPGICRRWIPALFIMLIFALPVSDLRSILLPFFFGLWYGGEEEVFDNWKISRTFCGGLFFGGIFSGISWLLPFWSELRLFLIPALVILVLFNSVLNKSWIYKSAMLLAGVIFIWFSLPDPPSKPENIDSGTVAVAFGLVENGGEGQPMPKISFIGDRETIYFKSLQELFLDVVSEVNCSKLPGTVSAGTDLVIVTELPDAGDRGIAALRRALKRGALLVMPSCYWGLFPGFQWEILPGSNGEYAVTAADRTLKLDPDKIDRQFAGHFRGVKKTSIAPTPGALAGMLVDFRPESIKIDPLPERNFFKHLIFAALALAVLLLIWIVRAKRPGSECFRIIFNCIGYAMLGGLLLPVAFRELPTGEHFRAIFAVIALIWIFRRPVPDSRKRFWYSGAAATCLLAAAFFQQDMILLAGALLAGGYLFAVLDGELCGKRDNDVEALRFLGFAAGIFISGGFAAAGVPWYAFFAVVAAMRLWSWLRN